MYHWVSVLLAMRGISIMIEEDRLACLVWIELDSDALVHNSHFWWSRYHSSFKANGIITPQNNNGPHPYRSTIDLHWIFSASPPSTTHPSTNTAVEECGVACLGNWSTVKKKPLGQFRSHLLWNYVSGFVFYHIHFHLRIGVIFRTRSRSWSIGSCVLWQVRS